MVNFGFPAASNNNNQRNMCIFGDSAENSIILMVDKILPRVNK